MEFISWREVAFISGSMLALLVTVFVSTIKLFVDNRYVTKKQFEALEDRMKANEEAVTDISISTVRHEEKIKNQFDLLRRIDSRLESMEQKVDETHDEVIKLASSSA